MTDTRTYLTAATYLAARARGVPFCLSAHGSLPGSVGLGAPSRRAYDVVLVRPMLGSAALLLAQTDHEAMLYGRFGGTERVIKLLPLPLDVHAMDDLPERGTLRRVGPRRVHAHRALPRSDSLAEGTRHPDRVGRAVARRGAKCPRRGRARRWGMERTRAAIRPSRRDGRDRFVGPLYSRDRFAAYADADVFCLTPRHWEETSVAALEAAAAGTAIVVTEQTDIPGIATWGVASWSSSIRLRPKRCGTALAARKWGSSPRRMSETSTRRSRSSSASRSISARLCEEVTGLALAVQSHALAAG